MEFVSGEPNGNCRSAAVAWTVRRGTSQRSLWGYHLSSNSLGAPTLTLTKCFLLGLVFRLGIIILFFDSIIIPGCKVMAVASVSSKGGIVLILATKSTVGCLKNIIVQPRYLARSRSLLLAVQ